MLVYLDESYRPQKYIFIGGLFIPNRYVGSSMHKQLTKLKTDNNFVNKTGSLKEIKYYQILSRRKLDLAIDAVKIFSKSTNAYFRCGALMYTKNDMDNFGAQKGIPYKLKEASLYTKAVDNLLQTNLSEVKNGVLLMDKLTRSRGDRFDQIIRYRFGSGENPTLKHISTVDSSSPSNHVIQICDLLLGAVYNDNFPCKKNKFKNEFREFVKKEFKLPSLKPKYWKSKTNKQSQLLHPKYTVRFYNFPYK